MESNKQRRKEITFSRQVTVEDIEAVSSEVEAVKFRSCKVGRVGWRSIIQSLSKKPITALEFSQCTNCIYQTRVHLVKNK